MSGTTYVPPGPCARCGTSLRYLSNYGCAECLRRSNRRYQARNREALLPKKRQWANENRDRLSAQQLRWQAENRDKTAKEARKRATPPWVDMVAIRSIYRERPIGMTVDHIVPLNGRDVCGLHVPWNLQYLTRSENCSKGNRDA